MTHKLSPGDRVMFSRKFCQSVGAYTGWIPFAVGTVKALDGTLVSVLWDGDDIPKGTLACNLVCRDKRHLEPV